MSWVLGVDSSTSGTKALIADERGRVVAQGQASHPLESAGGGGWEQDPTTWKSSFIGAVRAACEGLSPEERARIRRLAIAHQRETFVCTNERGEPLAPAIVWMDERASREVAEVRGAASERWVHEVSGKPVGLTPSLPKIRMLLRRLRPELRPSYVLDVHGFLAFWLTGAPSTSIASADPMGVVDLASGRYEDELIALSGAPREAFPRLVHVGEGLGLLTDDALASLGLGGPISLIAGAGDGQAAILGAGVTEPGRAVLNVGTALVCGTPIAKYRTTRAARTLKSASGEGFILETDLKGGTLSLDWLLSIVGADAREGRASRSRALGVRCRRAGSRSSGRCGSRRPCRRPDRRL